MAGTLAKIRLEPGRYVLAVSGGVDSMVLLDILRRHADVELVVAHFNHGIRPEAVKDEELVRETAAKFGLKFAADYGQLGEDASEDQARQARYRFLNQVKREYEAQAIITAHHQDDLLETALLNVLRGSGPLGLAAMASNQAVIRPLLQVPKKVLLAYALEHQIMWLEDNSNYDLKHLRNYLRSEVAPKITDSQKGKLIKNIEKVANNQIEITSLLATISRYLTNKRQIDRRRYLLLPAPLDGELMAYWLRQENIRDFDRQTIERLALGLKTAKAGSKLDILGHRQLHVGAQSAHFSNR